MFQENCTNLWAQPSDGQFKFLSCIQKNQMPWLPWCSTAQSPASRGDLALAASGGSFPPTFLWLHDTVTEYIHSLILATLELGCNDEILVLLQRSHYGFLWPPQLSVTAVIPVLTRCSPQKLFGIINNSSTTQTVLLRVLETLNMH